MLGSWVLQKNSGTEINGNGGREEGTCSTTGAYRLTRVRPFSAVKFFFCHRWDK